MALNFNGIFPMQMFSRSEFLLASCILCTVRTVSYSIHFWGLGLGDDTALIITRKYLK